MQKFSCLVNLKTNHGNSMPTILLTHWVSGCIGTSAIAIWCSSYEGCSLAGKKKEFKWKKAKPIQK